MTHLSLLLFAVLTCFSQAVAQEKGSSTKPTPPREYRLQSLYRPGIAQLYIADIRDTVVRTHGASTSKSYTRYVRLFMTLRCIESSDNISKVLANVDSLMYEFTADDKMVTYDSQKDIAPKNFLDLNNYLGILNRTAEITYNPYGEVKAVGGDNLEWIRDYLSENLADIDSVTSTIWNQSVSDFGVLHIADLQKRVVPGRRIAVDSSWRHAYALRCDNIEFPGIVKSTFSNYGNGVYTITTVDTLQAKPDTPFHVYGISELSRVVDGTVALNCALDLTTTGTINRVEQQSHAKIRARVGNDMFTTESRSTIVWSLQGQFQW
jgi:hypothetical protein